MSRKRTLVLVAQDSTGYWTKTAGKNSNTEADLRREFDAGTTRLRSRVVGLFLRAADAQRFVECVSRRTKGTDMSNYDLTVTRAEHLQWCKDRAIAVVNGGSVHHALASMVSDLSKHRETAGQVEIVGELGMSLILGGHLDLAHRMIDFINGVN